MHSIRGPDAAYDPEVAHSAILGEETSTRACSTAILGKTSLIG